MAKFYVVLFRLFQDTKETGGGVVFVPEGHGERWYAEVAELARQQFKHPLGPCVEVGFATLDQAMLERHCQRHGDLFWQGGDA